MSDSSRLPTRGSSSPAPPPPPPPAPVQQSKYSNRAASALARFAQPFFSGSRPPSPQTSGVRADLSAGPCSNRSKSLPGASQTVTHKTGIPIAALDISPQRTHAVVGGKEILKTIRVSPDHSSEEFNLRNAIIGYSSTQNDGSGLSARYKDQLTVRDVKWSHGNYDTIIATAVANGRIVLYDLHRTGLEYCRFQGHSRQVHKLAFNPHWPAWLLSGSQDSSIRMWDLRMASAARPCSSKELYNGNSDAVRDIRWSPSDGFAFATATDSGAIQLWDCRKTTAPVLRITAHDKPCFSVDWHPDGKHIVSGGTDRHVKVWDFSSSAERRQKPTFQFRTPQAVGNVRWRPPSWNNEYDTSGGWQSIQLVTSYDKEDPRIHLWDLRRPHIPFREFDRHESHAADLLWHSKDLLWTAGEAGVFTQTDIRYAPQVVNQRPMCSLAWSPSGEVLAFVQKRPSHNTVGLSTTEVVGHPEEESSSGEVLSQSPADDLLDEPSYISVRHRRTKSSSGRASKSLGSTPPGAPDFNPVLSLEKVLSKIKPSGQCQSGAIGSIAGSTMDQKTFRYLARHYSSLFGSSHGIHSDTLRSLLESLNQNADCAEDASLAKLSQTWRIVKFAVVQELQLRVRGQRQAPEKGARGIKKRLSAEGQNFEKPRTLDEGKPEKMKNRLFKGIMETEVSRQPLIDVENASNMTTPLAQPLLDPTILSSDSSNSHMTSLDAPSDIQPLPPSLLSSNQGTMHSNDWSSMSDVELRMHRQSNASEDAHFPVESLPSDTMPGSVSQSLQGDQRSAPRAIAGGDWRARSRTETSEVDEYDQKMEDKKAAIRDYKQYPKKILSLESHVECIRPPGFRRRESSESLPMFSASTGSSHPSKSIGTSLSSAAKLYDVSESEKTTEDLQSEASRVTYSRARSDSVIGPVTTQNEERQDSEPFVEGLPGLNVHLERPSSPLPLLKESSPLGTPCFKKDSRHSAFYTPAADSSACRATHMIDDDLMGLAIPVTSDGTVDKPWSAEVLLKEAIRHYHSSSYADIQSAAHLLQKLRTLFQGYEDILPSEECELIFKTYHEQLVRQCMYIEAAELRLLCVPAYPAVYEYAQIDTTMNVFCFTCKRPYENPLNDNTRCHRCDTPQEPCAICMSVDPPAEWVAEQSASSVQSNLELDPEATSHFLSSSRSSIRTEPIPTSELLRLDETYSDSYNPSGPKGSALWTWCQGCGHGGHLACISMWLNDTSVSEGGCATPGCMHDCGPGPRREHNRTVLLEESKRRDSAGRKAGVGFVKRDPWTRGESKAVEKVRGMLSIGTSGGTSASTTSAGPSVSSNLMSPKKVRLVTPSEQGKRRAASSRTSLGGGSGLST